MSELSEHNKQIAAINRQTRELSFASALTSPERLMEIEAWHTLNALHVSRETEKDEIIHDLLAMLTALRAEREGLRAQLVAERGLKELNLQIVDELRAQLAAATAQVAVLASALNNLKSTAAKDIIYGGAGCSRAYIEAEAVALDTLSTLTPAAQALLDRVGKMETVVEAAKNWRKIHGPVTPRTSSAMIAVMDALSALGEP